MKVQSQHIALVHRRMTVVGVFDDNQLADQAVSELSKARFAENQIGVAAGAGAAGFVGLLVGGGVSENEAKYYQDEFEAGRTIVTVAAGSRSREATAILRRHGSYDMISGILSRDGQ